MSASIHRVHPSAESAELFAAIDRLSREDSIDARGYEELLRMGTTFGWLLRCDCSDDVLGSLLLQQAADEVEILFVGVRPGHRRKGFGTWLLRAGLADAAARGATCAYLEVRESNMSAQMLYGRLGFARVGIRRSYYADGENACVMRSSLLETRATLAH